MPWYLNPFQLTRAVRGARGALSGGGPKAVRVTGIGAPHGLVLPTSTIYLEVDRKDGTVARFAPEVPVPWPYAWSYRLARHLGVPLVSDFDPERVSFGLPLPRGGPARKR
ncbi:MAG TPA: hypothetical protein VK920_10165 [Solirubrobacterales bacterium]|nr:hypothetical protein [Solirubrobacterales bacterium]